MLTRALYLVVGWLMLSFVTTLLRGTRLRSGSQVGSLLWLVVVMLCGDLWALLTFGVLQELVGLTLITFIFGWWWIRQLPNWNALGQTLWVMSLLTTFLYVTYSFAVSAFTPLHPLAFVVSFNLTLVELAALLLALTFAFESLDVCCRIRWKRLFQPMPPIPGHTPKVSLHVPAYNEPPEVVEATLRSLATLDYPNFEVLLIDNNTPRESTWRPLEKICRELGPRFRFLHLDKWPGYKSGALNFALTQTAPDAEIIGIIDADYLVSPDFLRDMTPFFIEPRVAFVQTPQDYRDYQGNPYLEALHHSYNYFFAVSMPSRNEHNAIIFAGTMGLIRRIVLQEIGGWDEWCITEDAEASLRVLQLGYDSVYVNKSYGTGLMPYTFDGLKKQRFRWCFGGIQILKKHWEALMPWARQVDPDNRLTLAQRYYYLVGGLQWFNEPLNLCFTIFLIMGALIQLSPVGGAIRPLTGPLIVVPVVFLVVGILRFLWVLRYALRLSTQDAIRSMASFFSLGWTVTLACIQGVIRPAGVFMRTPKLWSKSGLIRAFQAAQWEAVIGVMCVLFAITIILFHSKLATVVLGGLLIWQASLYLAALYYSLFSVRGQEVEPVAEARGVEVRENWLARWAVLVALVIAVIIGGVLLLPVPAEAPPYASFQPKDIPPQALIGLGSSKLEDKGTPTPSLTPTLLAEYTATPQIISTATVQTTSTSPGTATMTTTSQPIQQVTPTQTAPATAVPVTPVVSPSPPPTTPLPTQPLSTEPPPTPSQGP